MRETLLWAAALLAVVPVAIHSGGCRAAPGRLTLAERGCAPRYTIVLPESPSPSQALAATELQKYVREMTGVTLPVATNATPAHGIFLGNGPDDLSNDGFRLEIGRAHV